MGKIQELFYKITRGGKPKPWEHGPASVLKDKCGCGGNCQCNSIESLEKSAGISKKVSIKVVPATVDGTATSVPKVPAEIRDHLIEEGHIKPARKSKVEQVKEDAERMKKQVPPVIDGINKKAAAPKKPAAKTPTKKEAIAKDLADEPVAKKTPAKKPSASTAKKPAPKKK
jgi:translation initiation factor 1 (eIF-1/SUI1)